MTDDTYEVWVITPYASKKVWGGEDDIVAIQAWRNFQAQFTPSVDYTVVELSYISQGMNHDSD